MAEDDPLRAGRRIVTLDTGGDDPNVNLRVEDVAKVFLKHLSPRLTDLLEVAAYVYTFDAATRRGTEWEDDGTLEPWGRDLRLVIPVRDLAFWQRPEVTCLLARTLGFLSDDTWAFDFRAFTRSEIRQEYLQFSDQEDWPFHAVERVLMFSGGLDSTAGAVETADTGGRLVLVSHRSVTTMYARQRRLFGELDKRFPGRLLHVPVWLNKAGNQHREATQRTRRSCSRLSAPSSPSRSEPEASGSSRTASSASTSPSPTKLFGLGRHGRLIRGRSTCWARSWGSSSSGRSCSITRSCSRRSARWSRPSSSTAAVR
jgi:hypothetical protein